MTTKLAVTSLLLVVAAASIAGDNATYVSQSVPSSMQAGGRYRVTETFQNSGTTSWTETGGVGSYRLGSRNPDNNTIWGWDNRAKLAPGESVVPGASKTFGFEVTAPSQPGNYNFQWSMVHEGIGSGWFGSKSPNVVVTVTQPAGLSLDIISRNGRQIGLRQFTYQGQPFLTGGGIYLICSRDGGADNPQTNFGSEQSNDGVTMSNGAGQTGPSFRMSFERTSTATFRVSADIGPVSQTIFLPNLAIDFDKSVITSWAFDGTSYREGGCNDYRTRQGSTGTFAGIRSPCPLIVNGKLIGYVGVVATGTSPNWWQVSGSGGSVKVVVNKATARNLTFPGFTRHPYTYNIGFGFSRLDPGQSAHLDGTIQVTR